MPLANSKLAMCLDRLVNSDGPSVVPPNGPSSWSHLVTLAVVPCHGSLIGLIHLSNCLMDSLSFSALLVVFL